ncbi:MAG: cyanophycinase [Candidatus Korarchaeota archaeon]|nr:cyanophycinase [Candidatus Korarchaeota archaeon]NIU85338.1 cyanophycinase [Candidatus Thorarchaeota archaeon]NIW15428.1 cyanophycinase [Candidatus Thorarchaeota archaeon]NIW53374.1 cyanophycinase [Candidatus Korarchaeota archaeon]
MKKNEANTGSLVIIGGGLNAENEVIYEKILELAGGREEANIAIIPVASSVPLTVAYKYRSVFEEYHSIENCHLIPIAGVDEEFSLGIDESKWKEYAYSEELAQTILDHNAIFFVGGSQTRISNVLGTEKAPPVLSAIQKLYERGGVIAGSSAGAAIMSETMIGSGESLGALLDGVSSEDTFGDPTDDRVYLTNGLGFIKNAIIDQHFLQRGRLGRLLRAIMYTNAEYGYGIAEDTAIVFERTDSSFQIMGDGGVIVLDVSSDVKRDQLPFEGVKINYLTHGDTFDIDRASFTVSEGKDIETKDSPAYETTHFEPDVFAPYAVKNMLTSGLIDNTATSTSGIAFRMKSDTEGDGIQLTFSETGTSWGFKGELDFEQSKYTVLNVDLSVHPIELTITPKSNFS